MITTWTVCLSCGIPWEHAPDDRDAWCPGCLARLEAETGSDRLPSDAGTPAFRGAWGSRAQWTDWTPPPVLHEGLEVDVYRWQTGGWWERGRIEQVLVHVPRSPCAVRVAGIDLREWWSGHVRTRKSGRPLVAVVMRGNRYWLTEYRVDAVGEPVWPEARVVVDPAVDPSLLDDAWVRCVRQVEDYEQSLHERNSGELETLRESVQRIARVVDALARELGVGE